jgi:hypothetical protein
VEEGAGSNSIAEFLKEEENKISSVDQESVLEEKG